MMIMVFRVTRVIRVSRVIWLHLVSEGRCVFMCECVCVTYVCVCVYLLVCVTCTNVCVCIKYVAALVFKCVVR